MVRDRFQDPKAQTSGFRKLCKVGTSMGGFSGNVNFSGGFPIDSCILRSILEFLLEASQFCPC